MKNLLSMVDFVFEQQKNHLSLRDFNITNYANFLKQPLEIWMFVPCDEDGNALEEPKECDCNGHIEYCGGCVNTYPGVKYQQAKERCLFNGFSIKIYDSQLQSINSLNILDIYWKSKEYGKEWYLSKGFKTINDLVIYGLELTQFSINKIYSN